MLSSKIDANKYLLHRRNSTAAPVAMNPTLRTSATTAPGDNPLPPPPPPPAPAPPLSASVRKSAPVQFPVQMHRYVWPVGSAAHEPCPPQTAGFALPDGVETGGQAVATDAGAAGAAGAAGEAIHHTPATARPHTTATNTSVFAVGAGITALHTPHAVKTHTHLETCGRLHERQKRLFTGRKDKIYEETSCVDVSACARVFRLWLCRLLCANNSQQSREMRIIQHTTRMR